MYPQHHRVAVLWATDRHSRGELAEYFRVEKGHARGSTVSETRDRIRWWWSWWSGTWKSNERNRKLKWESGGQTRRDGTWSEDDGPGGDERQIAGDGGCGEAEAHGRRTGNCATENRFGTFTGFVRTRLMTRQILSISHYSD